MGCEIIMSGGWRQIEICRKGTDQKKEGRDDSVKGESEDKSKIIFLYIVPLEGSNIRRIWGEGRCSCFAGLSQQFLSPPRTIYVVLGVRKQAPHCQCKHPAGGDGGGWPHR